MLNPIPIQYLALLAYFILRAGVAIILVRLALSIFQDRDAVRESFTTWLRPISGLSVWLLITGKLSIAGLLLIGWYTQYAALALMLMSIDLMISKRFISHPAVPSRIFYMLLFFAATSLFITGAGAFAVDLPI